MMTFILHIVAKNVNYKRTEEILFQRRSEDKNKEADDITIFGERGQNFSTQIYVHFKKLRLKLI